MSRHDLGHPALPEERRRDVRRAVRLEVVSLGYLLTCVAVVAATMGNSQAMKAAWIEDLLSLIPPTAFLVAVRVARKPPDPEHPYGHHRSVATGHLVAAVALLTMGLYLLYDNVTKLVTAEHPSIGTVQLLGVTFWQGWLMVAAMVYTGVGPVILGRLKLPLAERLHDKVLHADADMNKADWMTAGGAVLGVIGIGLGLWWADAVAALAISVSVLRDGWRNVRHAVDALVDARAHTVDDTEPHPLNEAARQRLAELDWVREVGIRVRDQGHVFHLEAFVVPHQEQVGVAQLEGAAHLLEELDWKIHDVVVTVVSELPEGKVFVTRGDNRS
ncbi:cation transporter [Desertihabitans brevis]|uniref:Cation transporter n=1 Tax=Desertihabitans brevis TaxID=2268447 RepID=A0A367YZL9_9ACTN|nr:cation diffusion facilitator family transporter [Desertihabitans brevis]RCK71310.1 cation transporter [Desertihabitans brevis]